jgi:3-oxoacyl-[acyl-carrier-protein] synthase-3
MTGKIIGIGNCIPSETIDNLFFNNHIFLDDKGVLLKMTISHLPKN